MRLIREADVIKITGSESDVWRLKTSVTNLGPTAAHKRLVEIEVGGLINLGSPIGPFEEEIAVIDNKFCGSRAW
jgi:hypothetical protein